MKEYLAKDWACALSNEFQESYFKDLDAYLDQAYRTQTIFPPKEAVFCALNSTPLNEVKVLLLGQDPYHNINQAHGLSFSVQPKEKIPPSLKNIHKELASDLGCKTPNHGCLKEWADQGVLLLNTVLTVRAHEANSHRNIGWEKFTDAVIGQVNAQDRPLVVMLWGKPAQTKKKILNNPKHLVLTAPHPSPLSAYRGFLGCNHFSMANSFLEANGLAKINWCIDPI